MDIKEIMLKREALFSRHAALDGDAIRLRDFVPDIRPNYFRDIDRIIHTASYTRYMDKTQVFPLEGNAHITKRMVHVQLVSKIARTIGRALSLNEDLIEAIALGHDLGHVPFGHAGEYILDEISRKNNEGNFMHNVQSVRALMVLENKNITIQVLDGILCHNGESISNEYYPKKKTAQDFLDDYNMCYQDAKHAGALKPMTLEGCVVRISDIIGYIGRDIEDAVELGVLDIHTLPADITAVVGKSNKEIINTICMDIINHSLDAPCIRLSSEMYQAINKLKDFNYKNIYDKVNSDEQLARYKLMFNTLFEKLLLIVENEDKDQNIYLRFLNKMNSRYLQETSNARKVIDYIAGMTDDYFLNEYQAVLPR